VILWRIATETRKYAANDLSGGGAAARPGRWNDSGEPVVYCAPTIAMAVLETAAHIDDAGLPLNKYLVEIAVPNPVWALRQQVPAASLPVTWDAVPAGRASVQVGSTWLASVSSPILLVPSVIVPEEEVALINPRHSQSTSIKATARRKFQYNVLFRNMSGGA
jgi:RES domain-containing protein